MFLEACVSRFSSILASKTTKISTNFYHVLSSTFHWFLRPFRPPNPLFFNSFSTPSNIDGENWDFVKILIFPKGKSLILRIPASLEGWSVPSIFLISVICKFDLYPLFGRLVWGMWGSCWPLGRFLRRCWAFLGDFWLHLRSKWRFEAIFFNAWSIFRASFWTIFCLFSNVMLKSRFCKNPCFS